ncbi:MAG: phage holin family protein [Chitinophagaceae bacterium]|nr:MAG: phage holin family protein [Chitinophagaceae bacterium]
MNFLLRFLLSALAGYLLMIYLTGTMVDDPGAALLAAAFIALVNSFVKPREVVRRQPITIFTLALFLTVLNFVLLRLCDRYIPGFTLRLWWAGILIAAAITVVNFTVEHFKRRAVQ